MFEVLALVAGAQARDASTPTAEENGRAERWAAAKFSGVSDVSAPEAFISVLANHGSVQRNARGGKPLRIGNGRYASGLYCHAPSRLVVRLPGNGKSFSALAGVDTNDQTSGGRGSVVFSVAVGGKEAFRSPLMREGTPAVRVEVPLNGEREFVLEVGDGGDGISCDQADWASARAALADGREVAIGDLPIEGERSAFTTELPFSFTYGGRPSAELLKTWKLTRSARKVGEVKTEYVSEYSDPETGLVVRCVALRHHDFPTVEWTVYLKNAGTTDTPIIENVLSMDIGLSRGQSGEFILHHNKGDSCTPDSFAPLETVLETGAEKRFAPVGGRPSNGEWPYYNIAWENEGVIAVIGWPGQWSATFARDAGANLRIRAGQELTHFKLHPGEEVRTPLSLIQFYKGDWIRGQNIWRRFMFARVFPPDRGKPLAPKIAACSGWQFPGLKCNQAGEIAFIDRYLEEGIKLDYWWMDAGWYVNNAPDWTQVGTWEIDRTRYPDGLRAVSDHAHAKDAGAIVWFEPERVSAGTWLAQNHPEWVLGGANGGLLNLGNPDARTWLTARIGDLIAEQGIDLYRQDFNMDPLAFWRGADAEDRKGIAEIRHVEGYLAYWDALRARFPGMLIDSCASGGRRNDLETMRRAVPLLRTDCEFNAIGNQCHTYGFDMWLPYHECGNRDLDVYNFRSNLSPMMGFVWDVRRKDLDYELGRRLVGQWKSVADCFFGDFYPLTGYSTDKDVWMAWQFDRPDLGKGMIQAFRREESIHESARVKLRGLDPETRYIVTDLDENRPREFTGRELMEAGCEIRITGTPGAALLAYERAEVAERKPDSRPAQPGGDNLIQRLDGGWLLATDAGNAGRNEKWFEAVRAEAQPAPVPGIIQQVFPDYHGVAWYWRKFRLQRAPSANEKALIRFGAADYLAEAWVNGKPIGGHEGGETPFELDATNALLPDGENLLAVRILNTTDDPIEGFALGQTPHRNKRQKGYQPGAMYNYGGILLPVDLVVVPKARVRDVYARSQPDTGGVRITITLENDTGTTASGVLMVAIGPKDSGETQTSQSQRVSLPPGQSVQTLAMTVANPRLWSLDDPYLYQAQAIIDAKTDDGNDFHHRKTIRFGFRDFRVADGFFQLNGKRVFFRSTHTGNHFPIGQVVPVNPDFMRRDLLYAKACGFNAIRFIAGVAWPEQLDYCDEIGLMVYEESLAGWCLEDSPKMAERYLRSTREMILRDRNHPSVTIWGMLNEQSDGPVFREAVKALAMVRDLDDTRLVLLNSGRWDCQPSIGSVCNPGSREWEHQWGVEAPNPPQVSNAWNREHGGYFDRAGDAHVYPGTPLPHSTYRFIRNLGSDTKPVFLSEFGTGSVFNAADELARYEQAGARSDIPDAALIRSMLERLRADWGRFGMDGVYPFIEDFFRESYTHHIRQRMLNFDLVRSNPRLCGYNITGCLDHAVTGEGLWTFWREWKPGIADALRDGWSPLRWCLFTEPWHAYRGRKMMVEAVIATEDVLPPGEYPARFRIHGPTGVVWERQATLTIPQPEEGKRGPLAVPVLKEEIILDAPAGEYTFAASLERGGGPMGDRVKFFLSDEGALPKANDGVTLWGVPEPVGAWLAAHGVKCGQFARGVSVKGEVILVGVPENPADEDWADLVSRIKGGATAVFLDPRALRKGDDSTFRLPLEKRGRCYDFGDWLYHKECVGKRHPVFDGLQSGGILDWDYYDEVIPHAIFDGQDAPDDTAAAAFAVGYCCPGGYASGFLIGSYKVGEGRIILNTMRILENVGRHPAADRLLLNLAAQARRRP